MALAKLKFTKMIKDDAEGACHASTSSADIFTCQFNPETFNLFKKNSFQPAKTTGTDVAKTAFTGGEPQNMDIALTFDTTSTGDPVFEKYEVLRKLSQVDRSALNQTTQQGEPPWVMVQWGTYIGFIAVITGLDEQYVLFTPDGTPLRAKVTVHLQQVKDDNDMGSQNPSTRTLPRRTWVVEQGQRLDWIAHQEYGNSAAWRDIAEINGIDNPMELRAGQVLVLPVL